MITFTKGDIFTCGADILVNPVNCIGVMGKGIAAEFKSRYPKMFSAYAELCSKNQLAIGDIHAFSYTNLVIINFPTKLSWRNPSKYQYIVEGLKGLKIWLQRNGIGKKIAIPALGCGNGGLEWDKVSCLIEQYLGEIDCEILVFKPLAR